MDSFRFRLLLSYIVYGIALMAVAMYAINGINESDEKKLHIEDTVRKLTEQKAIFEQYTGSIDKKLFAIRDSKILKRYLDNGADSYSDVVELFSYVSSTSADMMQLRYIDEKGFEKIRVDRLDSDSTPVLIPANELQNKSDRYYFKEIMQLEDGEKSWYSKIDLNIEHDKIEKPIKPTFRVGIPVFAKDKKVGVLIINVCMKFIISEISNLSLYNVYLIDKDGDFILHPKEKYSWGKYLNTNYTIKNQFKESYQNILDKDEYLDEKLCSKLINLDNGESIKMILEPKFYKAQEHIQKHIDEMMYIMFFMVLLSVPVAYLFSSKFSKLKEEVDILNTSLEQRVQEKTENLQNLNETLEQRVKEEVDKNREKEKQLLLQSRLAQVGEMISMIAHQWRQPLAAISSTVGTMKLDLMMNKYEKEFFEKSLGKISEYALHLSSTINDFRSFFKDDKEQKETSLEDIIEGSLGIIGPMLISNNIKLVKEYGCNERFSSYPNELKQVVLNLIKNAEDALLENNIENPTIYLKSYKEEDGNRYIMEVGDNAGGVPEDIADKIFMPYFSTKKNKDGTGLGLYLSKIIIEDHCKGKLSFVNGDEGAVFKIELGGTQTHHDAVGDEKRV